MTPSEFRYGAFISYRHVEPDRTWAKWLHRELETYRVPKALRQRGVPGHVARVFRDEEELAASPTLSAAIEDALVQSRFLIVVWSPRTPDSRWVNEEVLRFRELGRGDQVLALLIEGQPSDSFPRALCEVRPAVGSASTSEPAPVDEVEPLAADVRPVTGENARRLKRMAKLKLAATILGCRFDDLRQRDQERRVRSVVFDATGMVLLSSSSSETLRWDLRAVPPSATRFGGPDSAAGKLALSPDGRLLAIGSGQSMVSLWNPDRGQQLGQPLVTQGVFEQSLAFGPGGQVLAATDDFGLTLWDLAGAKATQRVLADNTGFLSAVAVSPDGKWVAAGGNDMSVRLWDLETNRQNARPLIGHTGDVTTLAFHPSGGALVSGSEDGTMIVWTLAPHSPVRQYLNQSGRVLSAAFSTDDHLLVTGSTDSLMVWDLTSGRPVHRRTMATGGFVEDLVFPAAGDSLLACQEQELRRWNVRAERPGNALVPGGCSDTPFTDSGTIRAQLRRSSEAQAIEEDSDYTITVSPLENGPARPRTVPVKFKWNRVSFAVSGDGRYAAVGTDHGEAYLWNLQTDPPERRELPGHAGVVAGLAFSPDGKILATGGHDATIRLWNVSGGGLRPPLEAPARVTHVRFNRAGSRLVALYDSALQDPPALQLWDVATGIPIGLPLPGTEGSSMRNVVAFSPNGRWIAAGSDDGQILLLDTEVATWRAHACRFANRNLSPTEEWPVYFPGQPYHKTCPDLPLPITIPRTRHAQEDELF
jgi:WD40 repeat protein